MIPRRFPVRIASQHHQASAFDRLTFTTCMLTIAVFAAVVAGYGPAAAFQHVLDVLRAAGSLPDAAGDLYGTAMLPL